MAEILPFRPWRYNQAISSDIESLISPLFDVVSDKQREALYRHPYNSIHLSVPSDPHDALRLLTDWKQTGVLVQDDLAAIYVYYQHFSLGDGTHQEYVRKGFICHIKAYDWEEKVILRHENTIPSSVNDRITLLENIQLNVSPTHGLYTDDSFELEAYMEESMRCPIYETEDYQGVREVLSVIHDAKVIRKFMDKLSDKTVILADGHHRYEGSLAYRKKNMAANPHHTGKEAYNFHLMYLTNTEANNLCILPIHRILSNLPDFDAATLLLRLERYFTLKEVADPYDLNQIVLGKKWAFGLILKDTAYKIRLKPDVHATMDWKFPDEIKDLDLTVLHYFAIYKALGIAGKAQRNDPHISYSRNFTECLTKVMREEAQCAFITQDVSMEEVRRVCLSGYTMPPKSTYFYPKVICGLLFSSIQPDEFATPYYPGL